MKNVLKNTLNKAGWVRAAAACTAVLAVHYWSFVVNLPGNPSFIVDTAFFTHFQVLLFGHVAVASAFAGMVTIFYTMLAIFASGLPRNRIVDKYLPLKMNVLLSVIVWVAIFLYAYSGTEFVKLIAPYLFDFWGHWVSFLVNMAVIAGMIFGFHMDNRRGEKRRIRFEGSSLGEEGEEASLGSSYVFLLNGFFVLVLAVVAGAARANHLLAFPKSEIVTETRIVLAGIVGQTSHGYVAVEENCQCSVLFPYSRIIELKDP